MLGRCYLVRVFDPIVNCLRLELCRFQNVAKIEHIFLPPERWGFSLWYLFILVVQT